MTLFIDRRGLLLGAAGLLCSASLGAAADPAFRERAIAGWRRRVLKILDKGAVPIIDMQATYVHDKTDLALMIEHMDALDIAQIAFAAANAPDSRPSLALHEARPEYFIPTTNSGEFPRWKKNPVAFVSRVREDLGSGQYFFMGEHEFRHLPSPEQVRDGRDDRDVTIPLDGPAGEALFALSQETGVAFQIHYEIEDRLLPALEAMLARYPKARVIWCHLAMIRNPDLAQGYGPDRVASLIERFPGLHFDLAVPSAAGIYKPTGARHSTLFEESGDVKAAWLAVIEKYPDRFLASSDYRPPVERQYAETIRRQRKILAALSPETRHRVAYGNAWRLLTGEDWKA